MASPKYAEHGTLVASTVTTLTFDVDVNTVLVTNRDSSSEIFGTWGGGTPTVEGDDTFLVLPGDTFAIENPYGSGGEHQTVKLISSGTPKYSVVAN